MTRRVLLPRRDQRTREIAAVLVEHMHLLRWEGDHAVAELVIPKSTFDDIAAFDPDGDPDLEPDDPAEPSLGAPETTPEVANNRFGNVDQRAAWRHAGDDREKEHEAGPDTVEEARGALV